METVGTYHEITGLTTSLLLKPVIRATRYTNACQPFNRDPCWELLPYNEYDIKRARIMIQRRLEDGEKNRTNTSDSFEKR